MLKAKTAFSGATPLSYYSLKNIILSTPVHISHTEMALRMARMSAGQKPAKPVALADTKGEKIVDARIEVGPLPSLRKNLREGRTPVLMPPKDGGISNNKGNLPDMTKKAFMPLCRLMAILLLVSTPLMLGADSGCGSSAASSSDFVVISDIHFNPFSDPTLFNSLVAASAEDWAGIFETSNSTTLSGYGSETNYPLLKQAFDSAAAEAENPVMVIYPGDYLGHGFNNAFYALYKSRDEAALKSFIYKTVKFITLEIKSRFPNQPVLFTLGNNDAYAGDYKLVVGGDFLADTAPMFLEECLEGWVQEDEFSATYKAGGYYKANAMLDNIRLISLNTVLFSTHRTAPSVGDAAYTQLKWFKEQLAAASEAGQKVYVLAHEPPGVDVFGTIRTHMNAKGAISNVTLMWYADYQTSFLEIMNTYKDLDMVFFTGHTHMDEFRLVYDNKRTSPPDPVFGQPSISPIFGNNPGYRLIQVSAATWKILDYTTHYIPLRTVNEHFTFEYRFSDQYGLSPLDGSTLETLSDALALGGANKTAFIDYYYMKSPRSPITEIRWPAYRCSTGYVRASAYQACVNASAQQ